MTEEIINTCEYYKICESACGGTLEDTEMCSCYELYKQLKRLEQENKEQAHEIKSLYDEKNSLHTIIDRLLENAGYSKDIASAEDFEDVYEDMQIKRNELIELEQENKELKEWKTKVVMLFESACRCKYLNEETDICSYTNEKCMNINKCVYKYQNLSETYRSALEEINLILDELKQQYDYMTDYSEIKEIQDKVNEVLG